MLKPIGFVFDGSFTTIWELNKVLSGLMKAIQAWYYEATHIWNRKKNNFREF